MRRRNWLDLSRKLVDRFDLDYSENAIEDAIDSYTHDYYGAGVAQTPAFPNGLVVSLSGVSLSGSVTQGVAFDPLGNRIATGGPLAFNISAADPALPRKDLLVLRYKKTSDTLIPKPSNPIQMVYLNLIDDFDLVCIAGVPNAAPVYPAALANDVILDGIFVPSAATLGGDCTLDDTVRMYAVPPASRLLRGFQLAGVVDGANNHFILPMAPSDPNSVVVLLDGQPLPEGSFQNAGTDILIVDVNFIPVVGQELFAIILIGQTGAMAQSANTIPSGKLRVRKLTGVVDGVNDSFQMPDIPIDPESVFVMIDGLVLDNDQYTVTGQTITLDPAVIPNVGQQPSAGYLVGSTSISMVIPSPGGALLNPYGTRNAPLLIDPTVAVGIAGDDRQMRFIACNPGAGAAPMTAVPQIQNGLAIGQELVLKGRSNADYPIFHDGDGLELNGAWLAKQGESISLVWDGLIWSENGRK
jgi:hypothetical protein